MPHLPKLILLLTPSLLAGLSPAQSIPRAPTTAPTTAPATPYKVSRWDQVPRVPFLYAEHVTPIPAGEQARIVDAAMLWGPAGGKVWFVVMTSDASAAEVYFLPDKPDGRLRKGKLVVVTWNENHSDYSVPGDPKDYWDVAPPGKTFATPPTAPPEFNLSLPFLAPDLPERDVVQMVDAIRRAAADEKSLIGMLCGHQRIGSFQRRLWSIDVDCESWEYSGNSISLSRRGNDYRCELSGLWVSP